MLILYALLQIPVTAVVATSALAPAWVWSRWSRYHQHKQAPQPAGWPEFPLRMVEEGRDIGRMVMYGVRGSFRGNLRDVPDPKGPPVLCIHGYTMNSSNFWALRAELERRGRPSQGIWLGLPGKPVMAYAPGVVAALKDLVDRFGAVDVVAHSMGGIVLRVALRQHPELARHVRRIVTLGSPHRGTAGARGPIGWLPEPADLHRRSRLLADLPDFRALAPRASVFTIGGTLDLVVYPPETAHLEGTRRFDLPVGHLGLVVDPGMARFVADLLTGGEPSPGVGPAEGEGASDAEVH